MALVAPYAAPKLPAAQVPALLMRKADDVVAEAGAKMHCTEAEQPPSPGMLPMPGRAGLGLKHWLAALPVAGAIWYVPHSAPLWAAQ